MVKKKVLTGLLISLALIVLFCAALAEPGGSCGEHVTWELEDGGILHIQGQGKMNDGTFWQDAVQADQIRRLIIDEGVTRIGDSAFLNCGKLADVTLPESLAEIGEDSFIGCGKLITMNLPAGIREITGTSFSEATERFVLPRLKTVTGVTLGSWELPFCIPGSDMKYIFAHTETSELIGLAVYELPDRNTEHVVLPEGIECIREGFFEGMKQLKSVRIPNSVTKLTIGAFAGLYRHFYIRCSKGSYAEKFALDQGLQYDNGTEKVVGYKIKDMNQKADWIIQHYIRPGMSEKKKATVLHNWLTNNCHYDESMKVHDGDILLTQGYGVCEAYAEAYSLLLSKAGMANAKIDSDAIEHIWNVVRIDGKWYHVDVTWDDPTKGPKDYPCISGHENHQNFLLTDQKIAANHVWDMRHYSADRKIFWRYYDPEFGRTLYMTLWTDDCMIALDWYKKTAMVLDTAYEHTASATIPDYYDFDDDETNTIIRFKVTSIADGAFRDRTKLKKVVIGKNIQSIGKKAFWNCSHLEKITIKTKKLTANNVGENAVKGISKTAVVRCPKDLVKDYKKLFRKKGAEKTVVFQ